MEDKGHSAVLFCDLEHVYISLGQSAGNHMALIRFTTLHIEIVGGPDLYDTVKKTPREKLEQLCFKILLDQLSGEDFLALLAEARKNGVEKGREEFRRELKTMLLGV